MRLVIFLGLALIADAIKPLGINEDTNPALGVFLAILVIMDIVDFIRNKK